jgi:hypothetical protein
LGKDADERLEKRLSVWVLNRLRIPGRYRRGVGAALSCMEEEGERKGAAICCWPSGST